MTVREALAALSEAVGSPVRHLDIGDETDPTTGRPVFRGTFRVEFDDSPWRFRVASELRETRSGSAFAAITGFEITATDYLQPEQIGKRTLLGAPLRELASLAAELHSDLGAWSPFPRPVVSRTTGRRRDARFYVDVASTARAAFAARQAGTEKRAIWEVVADQYCDERGNPAPKNTVQTWLDQCRKRGYLEPGELKGGPRKTSKPPPELTPEQIAAIPPELQFSTRRDDKESES